MDLIFGNTEEPGVGYRAISEIYGSTWRDWGLLSFPKLYTSDPKALMYIFKNDTAFPKPAAMRYRVGQLTGMGVLLAEGDAHKNQRRLLTPPFAFSEIKAWTPMFLEKSYILRDLLLQLVESSPHQDIDVSKEICRCTLDIVALASFDHDLGCLTGSGSDNSAFAELFGGNVSKLNVLEVAQGHLPFFRIFSSERTRRGNLSLGALRDIAREIITKKKVSVMAEKASSLEKKIHKDDIPSRDLLDRLIRANLADDLPESQRLTDEELLAQVTTILFAGFETTATSLSQTLQLLSEDLPAQARLRSELLAVDEDDPSLDALNDLPYLDAVVRETLRLRSSVSITIRTALHDNVLPLSTPVKNIKTGEMITEIPIKKGAVLTIPVVSVNTSEAIWGADALKFNPDRWLHPLPSSTDELSGFWSHQVTFLAGNRMCLGYRFSLAEMKAILFVLIRNFKFDPSSVSDEIVLRQAIVAKPVRLGREEEGATMPLRVSKVV
ncbi:cytochrome P450, partial [Mrakia frigida]|uniref:cytochrome P450 n=1 Tax=Mrakia frigida TaxID=29902 RepID=UPI003FCBF130